MTPISAPGRLVRAGDDVRLEFERRWTEPVADVWAAITDPQRCARWFGTWTGDPATGSVAFTIGEPGARPETVLVERCEPPHLLEVVMQPAGEQPWRLRVGLTSEGSGTALAFVQLLAEPVDATSIGPGWHYYLDRLDAVVRGLPVDREWDDYAPLGRFYPTPG